MRIAIAGAGAMALTAAAQLSAGGHESVIWSPSGASTAGFGRHAEIASTGALEGRWPVEVAVSAQALVDGADGILLAVDAEGHVPVMDALAPFIRDRHVVMVGADLSLGGLYLQQALAARGVGAPIMSWSTTVGTASRTGLLAVDIRTIRPQIKASVLPADRRDDALDVCRAAFGGIRFEPEESAIAIALLANSNPVFHVPAMLLNLSRIEQAEAWAPYGQTTPAVGRLMEALDGERLAVGAAFGIAVHSVNEHFHRSFKTPLGSMAQMNATLHAKGRGPGGPKSIRHRYLSQDIPYGLVVTAELARLAGVPAPVHHATITLASAAAGVDYREANTILPRLSLETMTSDALVRLASTGWPIG